MITGEVNRWLGKVLRREYSFEDAMYELQNFVPYLTKEELKMLKSRLEDSYNS